MIQDTCRKILGITPCIPIGRGLFQYNFGVIPRRHPVATVVGEPIHIPKISSPPAEIVDELHRRFTKALIQLFEDNKHKYEADADNCTLIIE